MKTTYQSPMSKLFYNQGGDYIFTSICCSGLSCYLFYVSAVEDRHLIKPVNGCYIPLTIISIAYRLLFVKGKNKNFKNLLVDMWSKLVEKNTNFFVFFIFSS